MKHLKIYFAVACLVITAFVYSCGGKANGSAITESGKNATIKYSDRFVAEEVWRLPAELNEISANVLVDDNKMACVQDNDAIIYIYNLKTKSVEERISFGQKGDYEGLALVGSTYYVLRTDGNLYQVETQKSGAPKVITYNLPFTVANDTESLFYDSKNKRLLIGVKEKDLSGGSGKGVYSFNLSTNKFDSNPVAMIMHSNEASSNEVQGKGKKNGKGSKGKTTTIKPSEIAIHPATGELYILNGPSSQLLIADPSGVVKSTHQLDRAVFPQPEGMSFTSSGDLYISSEASKKSSAVIAKLSY